MKTKFISKCVVTSIAVLTLLWRYCPAQAQEQQTAARRGIGGVRIGQTTAKIEDAYGSEYGHLANEFFSAASAIGDTGTGDGADPLELSIDVVKQVHLNGTYRAMPVVDGDVLTQDDSYRIIFQANKPCHLYIVQLDATGKMDPIFPSQFTHLNNPVEPYNRYEIPSGRDWLFLDTSTGVETVYFIASQQRLPEIEDLLMQLQARNGTLSRKMPVNIDQVTTLNRGISGIRPGKSAKIQFQNGAKGVYTPTLIKSIKTEFVMTRYFYHR